MVVFVLAQQQLVGLSAIQENNLCCLSYVSLIISLYYAQYPPQQCGCRSVLHPRSAQYALGKGRDCDPDALDKLTRLTGGI